MIFEEWLNKVERDKSVLEKIQQELVYERYTDNHSFWQKILDWLNIAYNTGYAAGKKEASKKEKTLV